MGKEIKITRVPVSISKTLKDEIDYAWKNLNSIEKQKTMGKKKINYSMLEVSDKIGKLLYSLRKSNK